MQRRLIGESFTAPAAANKFTEFSTLANESDVEQFFVLPLLRELGYDPNHLATKATVAPLNIAKGRKRRLYRPDYIGYLRHGHRDPCLIVDAKGPGESAEEGVEDAQLYAAVLRRKLPDPKPAPLCLGSNGHLTVLKRFDDDTPLRTLRFDDFQDGNAAFAQFRNDTERSAIRVALPQPAVFAFDKPGLDSIPNIFEASHKLIWKTEKRSPPSAFYEFAKLMYVKIREDRELHDKNPGLSPTGPNTVPSNQVRFSAEWIDEMNRNGEPNPVETILFKQYREELEQLVRRGEKKRIYETGETIDLMPATIRETVRKLEHYDFHGIDEDLNGRLFETFLTATMRGQELGQFFTPRSVVKFMVRLANLQASTGAMDRVLDGCCGTGGFLIDAMAVMDQRLVANRRLSGTEREALRRKLRTEQLWGIDAGKDPPVARIARLNMLLHRDGGSRIYFADALDPSVPIDPSLPVEVREEREELRAQLVSGKVLFDVALTNPPFSMDYEWKRPEERRVLEQYSLARDKDGKTRTSLRSSVLFLERYWNLLRPGGKLLTVMDESVLNTGSMKFARDFIRSRFVVVAVVSLPQNTFVKAGVQVKTSVLYLRKKISETETQPDVFMAVSENVGHSDTGRPQPDQNDLPKILEEFQKFEAGK